MKKTLLLFSLLLSIGILASGCANNNQKATQQTEKQISTTVNDPSKEGVLIGLKTVDKMNIKVEFEPSKGMHMLMNGKWMDMNPAKDEPYHLEIKLEDPYSKTRISNSDIKLTITKSTGETADYDLHPMWGSSGLHYADNGKLMGDGDYVVTVLANAPTFVRGSANKDLWINPISTDFEFSIKDGIITSEPDVSEEDVPKLPEGGKKEFHVVVGDDVFDNMQVKVEFEDAADMYMLKSGKWMKMAPKEGEIHLEVKLTDNLKSKTRIPYSEVKLIATNKETGEKLEKDLHAMWGGSGLHYGVNAKLSPGEYTIIVDIGVPEFARSLSDKQFYMNPILAEFDYTH